MTLVDAKHLIQHLDEARLLLLRGETCQEKPEGVENEAVEQADELWRCASSA